MRHIVRVCSLFVMIALATSVIVSCGGSGNHTSNTPTLPIPKYHGSVTVLAGQATILDIGGGGDLIIPPGAMTPGAVVRATYRLSQAISHRLLALEEVFAFTCFCRDIRVILSTAPRYQPQALDVS